MRLTWQYLYFHLWSREDVQVDRRLVISFSLFSRDPKTILYIPFFAILYVIHINIACNVALKLCPRNRIEDDNNNLKIELGCLNK